jgi:hypothetical protein
MMMTSLSDVMEGYISRREVASLFETSYQTISRWEANGILQCISVRIGKAYFYNTKDIMAIKDSLPAAKKGRGVKRGTNRNLYQAAQKYTKNNEHDLYYIRKPKPCFEFPELLINFYQPMRLNRLVTVDHLLADMGD